MAARSAALTGGALLVAILTSGCMAVEENPLNVNSPREDQQNVSSFQQTPEDFGDDPLNLAENGANLCTAQPSVGYQEFTVLVHNEALETFTIDGVSLADPQGLTLIKAEISAANREGHHKAHGGDEGGHGTHSAEAAPVTPEAEPAGPVVPVPANGYNITTHEYVNLVVSISIAEGAEAGTAQGIDVAYSTGDQEFAGTHPLVIELTRGGCA
ncbi:hypothetical protein BJ994_000475 [Arthrobacter pigmenti]|uniref:Lipoprotein n=1 Tax=Arthrobacter pigmenti TaxID=271432 RepID=A0A846RJS6_9MICC|nr:hypothetical protein [Arthrobacter pigmenti]NJC21399.1 hypothetical protein [Arthrobacter pigmenti]